MADFKENYINLNDVEPNDKRKFFNQVLKPFIATLILVVFILGSTTIIVKSNMKDIDKKLEPYKQLQTNMTDINKQLQITTQTLKNLDVINSLKDEVTFVRDDLKASNERFYAFSENVKDLNISLNEGIKNLDNTLNSNSENLNNTIIANIKDINNSLLVSVNDIKKELVSSLIEEQEKIIDDKIASISKKLGEIETFLSLFEKDGNSAKLESIVSQLSDIMIQTKLVTQFIIDNKDDIKGRVNANDIESRVNKQTYNNQPFTSYNQPQMSNSYPQQTYQPKMATLPFIVDKIINNSTITVSPVGSSQKEILDIENQMVMNRYKIIEVDENNNYVVVYDTYEKTTQKIKARR